MIFKWRHKTVTTVLKQSVGGWLRSLHVFRFVIISQIAFAVLIGVVGSVGGQEVSEPNESIAGAYGPLTMGVTYNDYIWSLSDYDFFSFDATAGTSYTIDLTNLPVNYDLRLCNSGGSYLASSSQSGTTAEQIVVVVKTTGSPWACRAACRLTLTELW